MDIIGFAIRMVTAAITGTILAAVIRHRRPPRPAGAGEVRVEAVLGRTEARPTVTGFRHGRVTALYGTACVDLRRVQIDPAGAGLTVVVLCGGAEITVPDTWDTEVLGAAPTGGLDVRVPEVEGHLPRLVIHIRCAIGGVEVTARPALSVAADG